MFKESIIQYEPNRKKLTQLFAAGFTATAVMTGLSYLLLAAEIPAPDYGAEYGAILIGGFTPQVFSFVWWAGLLIHGLTGTFFLSVLCDYLAQRQVLPNERRLKGLLYGCALWFASSLALAPLAGLGIFFRLTETPGRLTFASLATWLVYGLVLDGMTRVKLVHTLVDFDKQRRQVA